MRRSWVRDKRLIVMVPQMPESMKEQVLGHPSNLRPERTVAGFVTKGSFAICELLRRPGGFGQNGRSWVRDKRLIAKVPQMPESMKEEVLRHPSNLRPERTVAGFVTKGSF